MAWNGDNIMIWNWTNTMVWNGNHTTPYCFLQVMKLYSVKSEVRYSPSMILVKLIGSHTISQVTLRISDIKRTKMVRPLLYPSSSCYFYLKFSSLLVGSYSLSHTLPMFSILHLNWSFRPLSGPHCECLLQQQNCPERD